VLMAWPVSSRPYSLFAGFREGSAKRKDVCFDCVSSIYFDLDFDREHTFTTQNSPVDEAPSSG
jgi:hypothetical protein